MNDDDDDDTPDSFIPDELDGPEPPEAEGEPALSYAEKQELLRLLAELNRRGVEGLKLYEPLPVIEAFHKDSRDERLIRGSNRAGKTLGAAVELARAVTNQDPTGKYPPKDGEAAIVGLDGRHLGKPIYQILFKPGAFKICKDLETGEWRTRRPHIDRDRPASDFKPAPPLIPRRFIKEEAWEEKKRDIPSVIKLTTGWTITFYSSKGSPPNGIQLDLLWIDEEIINESWWPEMVARLLDRKGKAYWSATPQVSSEHLWNLHVRAEEQPEMVLEVIALLEDNPYIDEDEKRKFESRIYSEEEKRVRLRGEFALTGYRIYPEYAKTIHNYDLAGGVPRDWSRWIAVDPGRQVCAVLFLAVPPPAFRPKMLLLYDELYIKGCDAHKFGEQLHAKMDGVQPEIFLIDSHASRITEMGSGLTVESQYSAARKKHGTKSSRTGYGFQWGMDDPQAGILAVHEVLRITEDGVPILRVARGRCPNFEYEIDRYHYRKINKIVSDQPEKKNDHLMDCLRYLVTSRPAWSKPKPFDKPVNYAVAALRKKLAAKRKEGPGVNLGPVGNGK